MTPMTPEALALSRKLAIELGQLPRDDSQSADAIAGHSTEEKETEMPIVIKAKAAGEVVHIPPGTYRVVCMNVAEDTLENPQYGSGEVYRFDLEAREKLDEEGNPIKLDGIANRVLSPKSKLWKWLMAFGVKFAIGEDIDIEECIGQEAFAVVEDLTKDGTVFSRVVDIIPAPAATARNLADISDFWAEARDMGYSVKDATEKAHTMYQKAPKDLDVNQRAAVLQGLG